ncbi:MAG: FAD-dependent oxidoreductase [Deltaproteobacteria bacterium]|nr:MAG: FAD-dependent oxidoreductase [Deltaproteobacteria bacterium]
MEFKYLFSPIKLGPVEIKNRILMSSHDIGFGFFQYNLPPERYIEYIKARARGGCGLLILGACYVHHTCATFGTEEALPPEELVPRLRKLAEAVHPYGTKIFLQLLHFGKESDSSLNLKPLISFSDIPSFSTRERPKVLTEEEIGEIIDGFGVYARAAREAGLDGVELHGAHGYIIQQSWSPWGNQRSDKYGEQMKFAFEVLDRVRGEVSGEMAVGIRISADDLHPGGMDNEKMQEVARKLESSGKVDYLNCSAGSQYGHYTLVIGPSYIPLGMFVPFHSSIRAVVEKIPVLASIRINDPVQAEKVLEEGHADMVVMTRAQIADPELANKAQGGKLDEIRHCIACVQGCVNRVFRELSITCTQNPRVGREADTELRLTEKKKKVVVVGGGPAGMEAARVAAERGHQVTLFEKEKELGGQVNIITRIPERDEFSEVIRWRKFLLERLGVKVVLEKEADEQTVLQESPDTVVLATGSQPVTPGFPGGDQDNVFNQVQVLRDNTELGEHVVIYDNVFKQQGITLADHLAGLEKKVDLVTPVFSPGILMGFTEIPIMLMRTFSKGVNYICHCQVREFSGSKLVIYNHFIKNEQIIEDVDSLIVIEANKQNDELFWSLKGKVNELYRIGDCASPRDMLQAIREGFEVGSNI